MTYYREPPLRCQSVKYPVPGEVYELYIGSAGINHVRIEQKRGSGEIVHFTVYCGWINMTTPDWIRPPDMLVVVY